MKKTFKEYLKPADGAYTEGPMSLVMHQGILYKLDVLFAYSKDLPVTMLDVADLKWQVNSVEDEKRVKKADLAVPILVHPQNGKYIVLDGNTRLHKAIKNGVKQLPAKIIFEDVLAFARMGSGPMVAWASAVQDQNAYLNGGATTIKPVSEAADPKAFAEYEAIARKNGWKKRVDHLHHPQHGTIEVNRHGEWLHLPHGSLRDSDEGFGGSNAHNFEKHLKRLDGKKVTEGKQTKSELTDKQLKSVIRAASMGGRIIADGKTVWPGVNTTVINSRQAKENWQDKGAAFEEKMKNGKFLTVVIKEPGRRPGEWVTDETFDTSITVG